MKTAAYSFLLPIAYGFYMSLEYQEQFQYKLAVLGFACVGIGTWARYKEARQKHKKVDLWAMIPFSLMMFIMAYAFGNWKGGSLGVLITFVVATLGSYMSVELIQGLKKSFVAIASNLKTNWDSLINSKNNNDEENNDFPDGAAPV